MLAQNTNISELETTTPGTPTGTQTPGTPGRRTLQVQLIRALGVLNVKSSTLNNLARHGKCDEIKGCLILQSFSLCFKSPNISRWQIKLEILDKVKSFLKLSHL